MVPSYKHCHKHTQPILHSCFRMRVKMWQLKIWPMNGQTNTTCTYQSNSLFFPSFVRSFASWFWSVYCSLARVELGTVFVSSMDVLNASLVLILSVVSVRLLLLPLLLLLLSRSLLVVTFDCFAWLASVVLSPEITVGVSRSCK